MLPGPVPELSGTIQYIRTIGRTRLLGGVTITHSNLDPPGSASACPSGPVWATMSDRASHDLARQHTVANGVPHTTNRNAQRAQQALHDRWLMHVSGLRITPHVSETLATCSAHAAADSAAAGPIVSSRSRTLIDLRKGRCELGTRANTNRTPLLPTERLQQWSGPDGIAWRASAFGLA